MSEPKHRKLTQYEWQEAPISAAAGGTAKNSASASAPNGAAALQKNVVAAALTCSDKRAYLVSGYEPRTQRCIRQVLEWDLGTRQWGPLPEIPQPFCHGAAVAVEDRCFVWGGWDGERHLNTLWVFGPSNRNGGSTTTAAAADAAPAAAGGAGARGQKDAAPLPIYSWEAYLLCGPTVGSQGCGPSSRCGHSLVLGSVASPASLTAAGEGGSEKATAAPEPVLYLFGGYDGKEHLNDVWRLWVRPTIERREAVWELVTPRFGTPPSPRDDAAVAFDALQERLYVFGGFSTYLTNDAFALDLCGDRNQWISLPTVGLPLRRQGSVAVVSGRSLVVCCGVGESARCLPQLLHLSLVDFHWSLVAADQCAELLGGRRGFMGGCGDRGRRILIYGGEQFPSSFNSSMVEVELERIETVPKKK